MDERVVGRCLVGTGVGASVGPPYPMAKLRYIPAPVPLRGKFGDKIKGRATPVSC